MKLTFLEWLQEVLPNDTAVVEKYPVSELIDNYPDLYDDYNKGNNTDFAKLYFENNLGDTNCYIEVRSIYDIANSFKENSEYVLVPKIPTSKMIEAGIDAFVDKDEIDVVYDAMINNK